MPRFDLAVEFFQRHPSKVMELEGQQIAMYLIYSFTQLPCLFHSHLLPLFIPTIADHFPSILLFEPAKINAKQAAEVSTVEHLKTLAGFMWHGCMAGFFYSLGCKATQSRIPSVSTYIVWNLTPDAP